VRRLDISLGYCFVDGDEGEIEGCDEGKSRSKRKRVLPCKLHRPATDSRATGKRDWAGTSERRKGNKQLIVVWVSGDDDSGSRSRPMRAQEGVGWIVAMFELAGSKVNGLFEVRRGDPLFAGCVLVVEGRQAKRLESAYPEKNLEG
jgi:hypothetical protein